VGHKDQDKDATGDSYRQTGNINGRKSLMFDDIPKSDFEIVFDHGRLSTLIGDFISIYPTL
jgi:hypothetical protein